MEYSPRYAEELVQFFRAGEPTSPPSLCKFALKKGVSVAKLGTWARTHSDFAEAMAEARLILQDKLVEWGLNKHCDATFAKYLLSEPDALWPREMAENHLEVRITVTK